MFKKVNVMEAHFEQATGRVVAELLSAAANGAEKVTCRVVSILPETKGGSRKPHIHPDVEEVIFVLTGEGRVWIEGEEILIEKDDLIMIPTAVQHRIINSSEAALDLLCVFPAAEIPIP
ncbi:cupin domain-containing protein [Desulfosporosinus fructosivorans]|uniref:Cupin domain-containing protein n=1 Tax=Desulfosporosinus fructosivorans TaxID=2018669 RepID=A0A4Z0RAS6_9FIRM|nr:cupin domain-containing protein [Desulfosporosinus fructosivorans]TGE39113.1 cupin domain-containing protein [Desulfosporosinus fructosivorans]